MKALLHRVIARIRIHLEVAEQLNRRVKVENALFESAAGKRPLPTADECRKLAISLGTPEKKKEKKT